MQTFAPYPDFGRLFRSLDRQRLGKQRVEAKQIIDLLLGRPPKSGKARKGWLNHPTVLMWKGYVSFLQQYYNACLAEWDRRGYRNITLQPEVVTEPAPAPWFWGNEGFHESHRSMLTHKKPDFYSSQWEVTPNSGYLWPDNETRTLTRGNPYP